MNGTDHTSPTCYQVPFLYHMLISRHFPSSLGCQSHTHINTLTHTPLSQWVRLKMGVTMVAMATRPDPCAACSEACCCSGETEGERGRERLGGIILQSAIISPISVFPHPTVSVTNYGLLYLTITPVSPPDYTLLTHICYKWI